MNISVILKNLRNLVPYFLLIAIYFFFINLEASKVIDENLNSENDEVVNDGRPGIKDKNVRISIPVIPYNQ